MTNEMKKEISEEFRQIMCHHLFTMADYSISSDKIDNEILKTTSESIIKDIESFLFSTINAFIEAEIARLEGMKKEQNPDCDCGSTIDLHSPRCKATVMNKEPLIAYNQALNDQIAHLKELIKK